MALTRRGAAVAVGGSTWTCWANCGWNCGCLRCCKGGMGTCCWFGSAWFGERLDFFGVWALWQIGTLGIGAGLDAGLVWHTLGGDAGLVVSGLLLGTLGGAAGMVLGLLMGTLGGAAGFCLVGTVGIVGGIV